MVTEDTITVGFEDYCLGQARMLNHSNEYDYVFIQNSVFFEAKYVSQLIRNIGVFNPNIPTGHYPITYRKYRIDNPSCYKDVVKSIFIMNDKPDIKFSPSHQCGLPRIDTIRIGNITGNVKNMILSIRRDDYLNKIVDTVTRALTVSDSIIYDTLTHPRYDSFYRRGKYTTVVTVLFYPKGMNYPACYTYNGYYYVDTTLFYSYITSDKTSGCSPLNLLSVVHTNRHNYFDSTSWYIEPPGGVYVSKKTLSPYRTDSMNFQFSSSGKYKIYAISKNKSGCIDTSNPIWVRVGDSIPPTITKSASTLCTGDPLTISQSNALTYDRLYFAADDYRTMNCYNSTATTIYKFNRGGKHYIRTYGLSNGCPTMGLDSVYVKGPRFFLDYDFKCIRRDSILFYLTDTFEVGNLQYRWDFGDGSPTVVNNGEPIWHKYTSDSANYYVKVRAIQTNPLGCQYEDSTLIHIRKVRAVIKDSIFCKASNNDYTIFPYFLNPDSSKYADYLFGYKYTWFFDWKGTKYVPISAGKSDTFDLPHDTVNTMLVARDINGCADTARAIFRVVNTIVHFTPNKNFRLNQFYCNPFDTFFLHSDATSYYPINYYTWEIVKVQNGVTVKIDSFAILFPDTKVYIRPSLYASDTYIVHHNINVSNYCVAPSRYTDTLIFYSDTTKLRVDDTICSRKYDNIKVSKNELSTFHYQWYINDNKLINDTFYNLQDSLMGSNSGYTTFYLRVEKTHRISGCLMTLYDTVVVAPPLRLRIDNTFDTAARKCPFSIGGTTNTRIEYLDTNNSNLQYYWRLAPNTYTLNPSNIPLQVGINNIYFHYQFHNCKDSILNADTVLDPQATMTMSKNNICKGDSIEFNFSQIKDVDSMNMVYGDGFAFHRGQLLGISSFKTGHTYDQINQSVSNLSVVYTVFSKNEKCLQVYTQPITLHNVKADFSLNHDGDTAFCHAPVPLLDQSLYADSFRWSFGDGLYDTARGILSHSYQLSGTYRIKLYAMLKSPLGCVDTTSKTVILHPKPNITASADTTCPDSFLLIKYQDILSPVKVYISPDSLGKNPYTSSPIKTRIARDTMMTLISVTPYNCKDTTAVAANLHRTIDYLPFDTIVQMGARVIFPFRRHPLWTYTWTPNLENPSCQDCSFPWMTFVTPKRYLLTAIDIHHCFKDTASYIVQIYPDILVKAPTAFTPNGDGINDIFYARGFGIKRLLNMKIYDRLGQLLFVTYDENIGWDGTYKGVLQNSDPYFYTYEAESFIPGKIVRGEGNFMLLR